LGSNFGLESHNDGIGGGEVGGFGKRNVKTVKKRERSRGRWRKVRIAVIGGILVRGMRHCGV
jgi:hypothetical protein